MGFSGGFYWFCTWDYCGFGMLGFPVIYPFKKLIHASTE
jgi:hypothetical protein